MLIYRQYTRPQIYIFQNFLSIDNIEDEIGYENFNSYINTLNKLKGELLNLKEETYNELFEVLGLDGYRKNKLLPEIKYA